MPDRINELYRKYVGGTLAKEELAEFLEAMRATSDEALWDLMNEGDEALADIPMSDDEKDHQLNLLTDRIHRHRQLTIFKYAAAVVLLVVSLSASYWFFRDKPAERQMAEIRVAPGNKTSVVLADGSKIALNSGTILQYDVQPGELRQVKLLQGEAYFDVAKDPDCPFRVSVNDMNIEVLGTKFNVKSVGRDVETSLFTGSVQLSVDHSDFSYRMKPGEKSIYQSAKNTLQLGTIDEMLDAGWKDGYLAFKSAPLQEVIQKIECWYGVRIRLQNKALRSDLLTGSFHQETLESVLKSLSLQYGFRYENQKDEIIIKSR